jgi:chemotaxis protein CheX
VEKYIKPFVDVCEAVFRDFCSTEVKAGRVFFASKGEYSKDWDISGIIGFSGEASGAVAISLTDTTACKVTDILTDGVSHDKMDDDVIDAVGEIINIIAGNVKKNFEEELRIKISLPSIVKGKDHTIVWPSDKTRIICIPFSIFESHEFCLSIAVELTK